MNAKQIKARAAAKRAEQEARDARRGDHTLKVGLGPSSDRRAMLDRLGALRDVVHAIGTMATAGPEVDDKTRLKSINALLDAARVICPSDLPEG